jgi:hypothetical protein
VEKEGGRVGVGTRWVGAVDQHDTDAVAPGCSDSGGRRTPRGHGGSGMRTGAGQQWGPVVSGRMQEGDSKSEAAAALTGGLGPHNARQCNSTRFESKQNSTGFKLISN